MSRARPIRPLCGPGCTPSAKVHTSLCDANAHWFDVARNSEKATADQLELLATIENDCDLDELLDEALTQGDVLKRLRAALGQDPIPQDVLERRQKWREQRQIQPCCRKCGKEGDSTKHHFVNKWILRELAHYTAKWADRSKNCIPLCIECHRDLHSRDNGPVSITDYLNDDEMAFAEAALTALAEERPKLLILIGRGADSVYEARLVKDWMEGKFRVATPDFSRNYLRAVA
jgi:hypothetical protein